MVPPTVKCGALRTGSSRQGRDPVLGPVLRCWGGWGVGWRLDGRFDCSLGGDRMSEAPTIAEV